MDVRLPNGKIVQNVPEGTSKRDVALKAIAAGIAEINDFGGMFYTSGTMGRPMPMLDVGRMRREYRLEKLRKTDPALAETVAETGPLEALAVGYGEGTASLLRGAGAMDQASEGDRRAADALRDIQPTAAVGKLLGQALPFAAASYLLPSSAGVAARTAFGGGLGAAEGGLIARGEGGGAAQVVQGAGLGLLVGAGAEIVAPALYRLGSGLIARVTGRRAAALDAAGNPTPELQEALQASGATLDDLVRAAEADPETLARAQAAQTGSNPPITAQTEARPMRFADAGGGGARPVTGEAGGAGAIPPGTATDAPAAPAGGPGEPGPELGAAETRALPTDNTDNLTRRIAEGRATPEDVRPNADTLAALERLGVHTTAPLAVSSDNPAFTSIYGQMSVIPGSRQGVEMTRFFEDVDAAADSLVARLGGKLNIDEVNQTFRAKMGELLEGAKVERDRLYAKVDEAVSAQPGGKAVPVDTTPLRRILDNFATEMGGPKQLARVNPAMARFIDDAENGMTYGFVDEQIKLINQSKYSGNPTGISAGLSDYRRDQLLGALQEVRAQHLQRLAPEVAELERQAARAHQVYKGIEDRRAKLLGRELMDSIVPKVGGAISRDALTKGNLRQFERLMRDTPADLRGEVVATALASVMRNRAGFDATGYKQWYEALGKQPRIKQAIEQHLPEGAASDLRNLYKLSRGLSAIQADRTKTGRVSAIFRDLDRAGGWLDKLKGSAAQMAAAEGVSTTLGIPGVGAAAVLARQLSRPKQSAQDAASDFLASPEFREAVIDYARKGEATEAQQRRVTRMKIYRDWLAAQPPSVQARVTAMGFIPWLFTPDPETTPES